MREDGVRGRDLLLGMLAGAAAMYLFDPARGARRRALTRDRMVHLGHELEHARAAALGRGRDLRNRARGMVAQARGRLRPPEVDDDLLVARVRSRLGHHVRHAGPLVVSARNGCLTLAGPIRAAEADGLVAAVTSLPGVRDVVDRLERRDEP